MIKHHEHHCAANENNKKWLHTMGVNLTMTHKFNGRNIPIFVLFLTTSKTKAEEEWNAKIICCNRSILCNTVQQPSHDESLLFNEWVKSVVSEAAMSLCGIIAFVHLNRSTTISLLPHIKTVHKDRRENMRVGSQLAHVRQKKSI